MKAIHTRKGYALIKCHAHGWHMFPAERWNFNGDTSNPTFSPSVRELTDIPSQDSTRCHFTITNGQIQYHGDCPHEFAGQTLPLLEWEQHEIDHYMSPENDY